MKNCSLLYECRIYEKKYIENLRNLQIGTYIPDPEFRKSTQKSFLMNLQFFFTLVTWMSAY